MNILWITNNVLPELAEACGYETSASGTWLIDWSQKISTTEGINLAIATVYGGEFKKCKVNNITYYLLPGDGKNMLFYTKRYEKIWKQIADDFSVDIVHLHGTEYTHGLSFLRSNPNIKAVVSVQGIISRIAEVYFDGLPSKFSFKYFTIKEILRFNSVYAKSLLYKFNSKYEKEIFSRVRYANVVNFWDKSIVKSYNPTIKCFELEYNLRDEFYTASKWDIDHVQKYQIFTNPGGDSIKGLHILCKAIEIVKKEYPNVKLVIPGENVKNAQNSGYDKYINRLIHKLDIEENVNFVGRLTGEQMLENMKKAHIVVVPSAIEGTSLVLREAMYMGVPCIAAFRGGMADFVKDKVSGFLYDYSEYSYLAYRIIELFQDDHKARKMSKNAMKQAEEAHSREKNISKIIEMYQQIFYEE